MYPPWARRAIIEARKADGYYKIGAVAVRAGNVLATGFNKHKNDPLWNEHNWSTHAEADCLRELSYSTAYNGARGNITLYVVRLVPSGKLALARPCEACQSLIDDMGIRTVVYSVSATAFATVRVRDFGI